MLRMTSARLYALLALATTALALLAIGLPDAMEAARTSAQRGEPAPVNPWTTTAMIFGFPA